MTNVWEETWTSSGNEPDIVDGNGVHGTFDSGTVDDSTGDMDDSNFEKDVARARLAACAPELARLVLQLSAWGCPICERTPGEGEAHREDCALDALLRKAGIR